MKIRTKCGFTIRAMTAFALALVVLPPGLSPCSGQSTALNQQGPGNQATASATSGEYVVLERSADARSWGVTVLQTNDDGSIDVVTNQAYTEIGTGLCRPDPQNPGGWMLPR